MKCKYYVDELSQQIVEDFEDYLTNIHGLALNTKSTYLKKFKLLISYAKQKGMLDKTVEIDFTGLTRRENSDTIYLTEIEVDALLELSEFSDKTEELVRDIFVLACRTGLRYSDFSTLSIDQIRNGSIYVIQQKTNEKVTIPIHVTAQRILDKYRNGFPPCPLNQPFNDYLKIIGKRIPSLEQVFPKRITKVGRVQVLNIMKWKLLQCNTARRTFCTIGHMKGTPIAIIMGISGHKDVKKFLSYVKSSTDEKAEQLRELWKERGEIAYDRNIYKNASTSVGEAFVIYTKGGT
jgi:integrase